MFILKSFSKKILLSLLFFPANSFALGIWLKIVPVAEDYTGGIDLDSIQINDPVILELEEFEGDLKPEEPQVIVNFTAVIPTNIGRKELH